MQSKPLYEVKVYKIWYDDNPEEFYIGSTKYDALYKRMSVHRNCVKHGKSNKLYQLIREKGGNFNYVQIASCMVSCSDERRAFEQEWVDKLKPTLNMRRAYTDVATRKQQLKDYHAVYYKKTDIEYKKSDQYLKILKKKCMKELKKKYLKDHYKLPEQIQRRKDRREKHKRICICGGEYVKIPYHDQQHYESKRHRDFIASLPFMNSH